MQPAMNAIKMSARRIGLTRSRRENPAFNYGFFRPNPHLFGGLAWKNEEHTPDLTHGSVSQQT